MNTYANRLKKLIIFFSVLLLLLSNAVSFANEQAFHPFYDYSGHFDVDLFDYDATLDKSEEDQKDNVPEKQEVPHPPISPIDDNTTSHTIEV